ncbi:MAG: YibE/F family protein [Candidatus Peribacteraceae bacterium]|nr:YibE/F family protein [Candidatus Peribacteraceae bacterium]
MSSFYRILSGAAALALFAIPSFGAAQEATITYVRADIIAAASEEAGAADPVQIVHARLADGTEVRFEHIVVHNRADLLLSPGDRVILQHLTRADGTESFFLQEQYRLPWLGALLLCFLLLGMVVGGWRGCTSILGLAVSIAIIALVFFPLIVAGWSPLLVCGAGAFLIALTTLYLSHGFNLRATLGVIATAGTLLLTIGLGALAVSVTKLFGLGSEESVFLQSGMAEAMNLRGLLIGGIIIGALGVLDDVTMAQIAAVDEVHKADRLAGWRSLYRAGISVGREHVASMINTLALAYIGASLPLFLLFSLNEDVPLWVTINSAFIAEEVVRTIVGSIGLLLAIPIATWLAARTYARR